VSAPGRQVKTLSTAAAAWWQGLAARERRLLAWGGVLVGVALLWWLALQPALRTLSQAPAEHERLDAQLQQMRREAVESQQLRALPSLPADQAAVALRAATDRLGAQARLVLQGERATVTFTGVGSGALRDWFNEARAGARARPVEANLTRGPQGFNGNVILALGGNP
jgi:general secretion pathway protein M